MTRNPPTERTVACIKGGTSGSASFTITLLMPQLRHSSSMMQTATTLSGRAGGFAASVIDAMNFQPALPQEAQVPVISTTVILGWKPLARAPSINGCVTLGGGNFADGAASLADEKRDRRRGIVVVRAGEEGVAALDTMHEALLHQEIERPVNGDRRRARDALGQFLDHVVGAERTMRRQQSFQHVAADRRKALAALLADRFGMRDCVRGTAGMIVPRFMEDGRCGTAALRSFSYRFTRAHDVSREPVP